MSNSVESLKNQLRASVQKLAKLSYLETIYNQINSAKDIDQMLTVITDAASVLNDCEAASLMLLNPAREYLYFKIAQGDLSQPLKEMRVKVGEGVAGYCAQSGQMVIIDDVSRDERFAQKFDQKTGFQSRNILCVPLKLHGEIIGVLEVLNKTGDGRFTPDDIEILERLATAAAISINNARLLQNTRWQYQNLKLIHEITSVITSTLMIEEVLDKLVHAIAAAMEVGRCSVMMIEGETLKVRAAVGIPDAALEQQVGKVGEGISGTVARRGIPALVPDIEQDELFARPNDYEKYKDRGFIVVPIKHKGEILGVLNVSNRLTNVPFHRGDLALMEQLAAQAAVALTNAKLYHEIEEVLNLNLSILQSTRNGIVAVGGDRRIVFTNQAFGDIFGCDSLELMGEPAQRLLDIIGSAHFGALLDAALERGETFENQEFPITVGDGVKKILLVSGSIIVSPAPRPNGVLLVVADLTRERELQNHLKHAERLASLGQLTAGIAHEIRNPLNIIRGFTQLVQRRVKADQTSHDNCGIVIGEVDRLNDLVQGMLDFARPEKLARRPVALREQFARVVALFKEDAAFALPIEVTVEPADLVIPADDKKLVGVWLNLLRNAADAMAGRPGGVTIVAKPAPDDKRYVMIEVTDRGTGITPENLKVLFTPFHSTKTSGTGLGLAVSHKVIEAHGGLVSVASTVGTGTTFTIKLPTGA